MWTTREQQLFDSATRAIGIANYELGLSIAKRLLKEVEGDPRKHAYVLGCKVAVALRHLGRDEEAREAFETAYREALGANERVVAGYIRNDQSSMEPGKRAIGMITEAIRLTMMEAESPDPSRTTRADRAYMQATLARTVMRMRRKGYCKEAVTMRRARRTLAGFRKTHPHYKEAYLVVLAWELEMPRSSLTLALLERSQCLARIATEIVRQGKVRDTVELLRSHTRRARIRP